MSFPEGFGKYSFQYHSHIIIFSHSVQNHKGIKETTTHIKLPLSESENSWRLWSHGQSKKEWYLGFLLFSLFVFYLLSEKTLTKTVLLNKRDWYVLTGFNTFFSLFHYSFGIAYHSDWRKQSIWHELTAKVVFLKEIFSLIRSCVGRI